MKKYGIVLYFICIIFFILKSYNLEFDMGEFSVLFITPGILYLMNYYKKFISVL